MNTLFIITIIILAAILDPIKMGVALIILYIYHSKWSIVFSTLIGGVVSEAMLTMTQITRVFGEGLLIQLLGSLIVSCVVYYLIKLQRKYNAT